MKRMKRKKIEESEKGKEIFNEPERKTEKRKIKRKNLKK